jgi:prolipoprotein diacylglyceryltransferase
MLYLGLVFGFVAGNYAANIAHLNSARVFLATLVLLIPALVGARLLFVLSHWQIYRNDPARIWRQSEGGAAMYGGVPLFLLVSLPLLLALQIPFGAFWDVSTFTILVAMMIARVGCLLNGCCSGRAWAGPLAIYLPNQLGIWQKRVPTQLLEIGLASVLLAGAVLLWGHLPFSGALFLYLMAGYGAGRFALEFTRENQARLVGNMTLHQAISVALVASSLTILLVAWPR